MSGLLAALSVSVLVESLVLAFGLGWILRGARDAKERHPNGLIEKLEDGLAGNGRSMYEIEDLLLRVKGFLEYTESRLDVVQEHQKVTRKVIGEVRGRPFDGSDRDN